MTDLPHLRLTGTETSHDYTARGGGGGAEFQRPPRDRATHAASLQTGLSTARQDAADQGFLDTDPLLLTYELQPHALEMVESLERRGSGIDLLSVVQRQGRIVATVRVPSQKHRIIEAILDRYATKLDPRSQRPKHQNLVENVDQIRLATQNDLWTDAAPFPATNDQIWWEVWLYLARDDQVAGTVTAFTESATAAGLTVNARRIIFPDRLVLLVRGTFAQWQASPRLLLSVAELRRAKELATDYVDIEPHFQSELIAEVRERIVPPSLEAPAVCLLDTGVDRAHPLLEFALAPQDTQSVNPEWGTNDHHQERHGTGMAGIALYGPLTDLFTANGPIPLRHRLESVKIIPRVGQNDPDLYGNITQEAIARAEVAAPERNRVACLTVTADSRDGGYPSSWSAAIDQMCAGSAVVGEPKLLCVAAGNLRDQIVANDFAYPVIEGPAAGVEDPAQAWNALTVGATTDLVTIQHPDYDGCQPIAQAGDLSPTSRTSLAWPEDSRNGWPLKPDLMMEGGNWATMEDGSRSTPDDLGLLTTILHPSGRLLTVTRDTSPATAGAARLAAQLWSRYPNLWPETIRALLVHSASWTDAMNNRFPGNAKSVIQRRLRCFGYGVPDLHRAQYSAENAATLLFEGALTPYKLENSEVKTNEMHVHAIPWPVQVLQDLGHESVTMRVTLSYFIEPSPGSRGWTKRHRYASHGLRFDVKRPTESFDQFVQRISASADEDGQENAAGGTDAQPWVVGSKGRTQGSLHSDWWSGTGADLAACGYLAIYPVTGWWRERKSLNRYNSQARYSLIVSLETEEDVDLYTEIVNVATVSTEITT